jgi:hypothetical protein
MEIAASVPTVFPVVGALIVLVVILLLAHGRARVLGAVGAGLVLLNGVLNLVVQIALADLLDQVATSSLPPVLAINSIVQVLLYGAGMILLGLAVAAGRSQPAAP